MWSGCPATAVERPPRVGPTILKVRSWKRSGPTVSLGPWLTPSWGPERIRRVAARMAIPEETSLRGALKMNMELAPTVRDERQTKGQIAVPDPSGSTAWERQEFLCRRWWREGRKPGREPPAKNPKLPEGWCPLSGSLVSVVHPAMGAARALNGQGNPVPHP